MSYRSSYLFRYYDCGDFFFRLSMFSKIFDISLVVYGCSHLDRNG